MSSRAQYLLRIGGRLKGKVDKNAMLATLAGIFKEPESPGTAPPDKKPGAEWPVGFVLKDFAVCQWKFSVDEPYEPTHANDKKKKAEDSKKKDSEWPEETMIDFRAEVHHILGGSLYLNRQIMLPQVEWFYHYREYEWHKGLTAALLKLNKDIVKAHGKDALFERIWYRDWQWYCGNSGC